MSDLTSHSATRLAALIRNHAVSPVEVAEALLLRIDLMNPLLNAIVTLAPDLLDRAREAEAIVMRGGRLGPLHGVPLTIKDTIETAGLRTTSGSRLRANYIPAADATAVARLKAAGAIILGKTNTPELAISYETDNLIFGHTNNPHNIAFTSGGSSGGEAAAIAACLSPTGLGSDLSGSIRVPAHFCGIAGLKPTSGCVPMDGHFPPSSGPLALGACVGPMARRVEDLALLFDVLVGNSERESSAEGRETSLDRQIRELRGWRASWYVDDGAAPVTEETRRAVQAAVEALAEHGLETVAARPPGVESGPRLWIELFSGPSTEQVRALYAGHEAEAGPLGRRILGSARESRTSGSEQQSAMLERNHLRGKLLEWLKATPLIVAPVGAASAFAHGARRVNVGAELISVFRAFGYSQTFNVFDLPAVSVPAGWSAEGLPIGVQVIGQPFQESAVLAAAAVVEDALGGWRRPPLPETD